MLLGLGDEASGSAGSSVLRPDLAHVLLVPRHHFISIPLELRRQPVVVRVIRHVSNGLVVHGALCRRPYLGSVGPAARVRGLWPLLVHRALGHLDVVLLVVLVVRVRNRLVYVLYLVEELVVVRLGRGGLRAGLLGVPLLVRRNLWSHLLVIYLVALGNAWLLLHFIWLLLHLLLRLLVGALFRRHFRKVLFV